MTFTPRPNVNMSDFINNLNVVHPEQDAADLTFPNLQDDLFLTAGDLSSQWFDFDQGANADLQAAPFEFKAAGSATTIATDSNVDILGADFDFQDFNNFGQQTAPYQVPVPIQAAQPIYSSPQNGLEAAPQTGEKRKASESVDSPYPAHFENEEARMAAEEDKRRRNTAASARFRVKKKQREQALEKSAKEMQDKMSALDNRIQQLETENKWLKNLVMEKKDTKTSEEIAEMYKKFREENESKGASGKDGVGTLKSEA